MRELVLSLDTTHEFGSVALLNRDEPLEEVFLHAPDGFGQVLYGQLSNLLQRHQVQVREVSCFAAASGPGSFTGVRVGLTAVKGLAEAACKPVVPVSNLAALAFFGTQSLRAPLLDARRGEVYAALYAADGSLVLPETVSRLPEWLASLPPGPIEFLCPDFTPFQGILPLGSKSTLVPRALAAAIGRIAFRSWKAGRAQDPAQVDANYVRRSDAELFWKDK